MWLLWSTVQCNTRGGNGRIRMRLLSLLPQASESVALTRTDAPRTGVATTASRITTRAERGIRDALLSGSVRDAMRLCMHTEQYATALMLAAAVGPDEFIQVGGCV